MYESLLHKIYSAQKFISGLTCYNFVDLNKVPECRNLDQQDTKVFFILLLGSKVDHKRFTLIDHV